MERKKLKWIASSKKDLKKFPSKIQRTIGYGLHFAQMGEKYEKAKVLKGFGSADVLEIIDIDNHGTYRAVYTVCIAEVIYVLHAFQKKSKQGIKTPKEDMDIITNRLHLVRELNHEKE